ncbi:hypothetical protein JL2886_00349 [Phaeobacter gallaeciensis]|uniref:Glycine zipper family protein n=1 Tax=Phaeobacter gallaeciensis TaxID=60890 RepID=A0A1B0ZM73_9RHOB|nr:MULTISPECIES: hypothetical protein [Phaeobacter]MDF1771294.1 hypothetical protein [Pseudophaeobacter sp. bin_em_oilr2.035]MEE2635555.1 hypothetical protein [Pseudomonadota bacterium]ANP35282.1 hypothetical protein JL2886_00349 [Phaeobacter gallaeciensis]MDE4062530.1 hypothetical protein [Phaeobacter gallaeciensis]MDE4125412.1 hypothetical protein [Phaeobacter gallaeciensis]
MMLKTIAIAGLCAATLSGCDTPSVDAPLSLAGTPGPNYQTDLAQCQASARQIGQGHIGTSAALGGAGGALVGATENSDKALVGAIAGAMAGAAVGDIQVKQAQRDYVIRCMQNRGHPVTG